jgi:arylsulfatase A-like enzyme
MHLDDAVGQLVTALEKAGKRDSTMIVFTSDNGGSQASNADGKYSADDYPSGKLTGNNKPLRGNKADLYEGGIRVTAFANWPGTLKPAKLTAPIHVADWMPTLCGLAGYHPTEPLNWDGQDVWPVLHGDAKPEPRLLYWAGVNFRARAVREGDWKLIVPEKGEEELFDLASDPNETTDLATKMPDKVAALRSLLAEVSKGDVVKKAAKE